MKEEKRAQIMQKTAVVWLGASFYFGGNPDRSHWQCFK